MNKVTHMLKILPRYFEAVLSGDKTFEIRDNSDREFQTGDLVVLREMDITKSVFQFTGRSVEKQITYVTNFAQKENYVVFGMADPEAWETFKLYNRRDVAAEPQEDKLAMAQALRRAIDELKASRGLYTGTEGDPDRLAQIDADIEVLAKLLD